MKYLFLLLAITILSSCKTEPEYQSEIGSTAVSKDVAQDPLSKSVVRGKEVYLELCVTCHLPSGKGAPGAFPPLNPSDWLTNKRSESIHAVKYGLKGEIVVNGQPYNSIMLPLGLDDQEVADVLNYAIQTWNKGEMVTAEEVAAVTQ